MTPAEERQHWTDLVSRNVPNVPNVPNVTTPQVQSIVRSIMGERDVNVPMDQINFWHIVSREQDRYRVEPEHNQCPCEDCIVRFQRA